MHLVDLDHAWSSTVQQWGLSIMRVRDADWTTGFSCYVADTCVRGSWDVCRLVPSEATARGVCAQQTVCVDHFFDKQHVAAGPKVGGGVKGGGCRWTLLFPAEQERNMKARGGRADMG